MPVCDVCGNTLKWHDGYSISTTDVVTNEEYWTYFYRNKLGPIEQINPIGDILLTLVQRQAGQNTGWLVCENCRSLFVFNHQKEKSAKRHASRQESPPDSGPASIQDAALAAGAAWQRMFGTWPTSLHKPPSPSQTEATQQKSKKGTEQRYCNYHNKTISLAIINAENAGLGRMCEASFPVKRNDNPCTNSFCIHSALILPALTMKGLQEGFEIDWLTEDERQKMSLQMGLKDHAPAEQTSESAGKQESAPKPQNSGCFIATACYGDSEAREVRVLRAFRDRYLSHHYPGLMVIRSYYTVSPPIARLISKSPLLKNLIRSALLTPIVRMIVWRITRK